MARNKYPEETVQLILDTAQRLFLEKGYDNTTIQDIVDQLGGLTKGAVYHHFKSKEAILSAVSDRLFYQNNPFDVVKDRTDLNGLQKLRAVARAHQSDTDSTNLTIQQLSIAPNPELLVDMIVSNRQILTPYYQAILEEGNRDGSIHTDYPRELAELMPILSSLWLIPSLFPATKEQAKRKMLFMGDMLEKMGVPFFDKEMLRVVDEYFEQIPDSIYEN